MTEAKRLILLPPEVIERHRALLAELSSELDVMETPPDGERVSPEEMERIHASFFVAGPASRTVLGVARRAPNFQWLHLGHSGSDAPIFQELIANGVRVTNSAGVTAEPIAQTAVAGMLALHRGFPAWIEAQRRHEWTQGAEPLPRDLSEQTLTVVGLGAIGGHVARLAQALGMHVIGVRRSPAGAEDHVDEWVHPDDLDGVLPRTDVLVLTVPLTEATEGMIGAEQLAALPRGVHLVNVARGAVVDEAALIEALRSGQVGGAYLDVFEEEPLPEASPLWELPTVFVSPHDSARSSGNAARVHAVFAEELRKWVRGESSDRVVS